MKRPRQAALLLGAGLGLIAGLLFAWFASPVQVTDIGPAQLAEADQAAYVSLIAQTYLQDEDLERARERLAALGQPDPAGLVATYADSAFLSGADSGEVRALTALAEALGASPQSAEVFGGSPVPAGQPVSPVDATLALTPSPTATQTPPPPTQTPQPSPSPAADGPTLELVAREITCPEPDQPNGLIEVLVLGEAGQELPAVAVEAAWPEGTDRFFTGLNPQQGPGFADFQMQPGLTYSVSLPGLSEPVAGVVAAECAAESGLLSLPNYLLVFAPDPAIYATPTPTEDPLF